MFLLNEAALSKERNVTSKLAEGGFWCILDVVLTRLKDSKNGVA